MKIPVILPQIVYILHDSYISKFGFTNYLFADLVIAWFKVTDSKHSVRKILCIL